MKTAYTIPEELSTGYNVIECRVDYDIEATINLSKNSMVFERGTICCGLVFLVMRRARSYFEVFFELASKKAAVKGEKNNFF